MSGYSVMFIGAFAPDTPEYTNAATSRAAVLFQQNLVSAMHESGVGLNSVYAYCPMPSFPKSRLLVFRGRDERMDDGATLRLMGFLNLGPFKTLTLGIASYLAIKRWAGAQPGDKTKVVVAYNLNAPPAWPIRVACHRYDCLFVPFIGDIYVPGEVVPNSVTIRLQFAAQVREAEKLPALIAANQRIVDDFCPFAKSILVEGGVTEGFLSQFPSHSPVRDTTTVAFAGALTSLNGVHTLLEATRLIEDASFRFVVAGRGELETEVREAARLDSRIEFRGLVAHDEVVSIYQSADILVSLRRTDNRTNRYVFPSKTIECLATGRPLVTTPTGQMLHEFGDLVVSLFDESPLGVANALKAVAGWTEERRSEHFGRAQKYIRQNRTWRANAERIKQLFDEAVAA